MNKFVYELQMDVRDYELDFQGIVNNSVYLNYMEHTRHEFVKQTGINLLELHRAGIDAVVVRIDIAYKNSLRSGDRFTSRLSVKKQGIRFIFNQAIYRLADEKLMVSAHVESVVLKDGAPERHSEFDTYFEKYIAE